MARQEDKELCEHSCIPVPASHASFCGRDWFRFYEKIWLWSEGETPKILQALSERRESVITAMNEEGIHVMKVVRGTVDGDEFLNFIQRDQHSCLLTVQILILDNCSVHHVSGVASRLVHLSISCPLILQT